MHQSFKYPIAMRIKVLYFGQLQEIAGGRNETAEIPAGSTLNDLMSALYQKFPGIKDYEASLAIAVNQEFARMDHALGEGDEVALLPPVSGGNIQMDRSAPSPRAAITVDVISQASVMNSIKRPEDGAVAVFDGIVRNQTRGRQTLYLEYDTYLEMALKQMEQLAEEAIKNYKVRDVRIIHRIGKLQIGETSIFIAVASAHRAAAMDACRWLIDTIKKTVPIWKKEFFADGAVWADGEAFPDELKAGKSTPAAEKASK